jgi:hypothetical protein
MKNWKTTLAGIALGISMLVNGAMEQKAKDPNAPPVTAGNLIPAAIAIALGIAAKDNDVTGGTKQQ